MARILRAPTRVAERERWTFVAEPTGEAYRGLIDHALRRCCPEFLLVVRGDGHEGLSALGHQTLRRLASSLIAEEEALEWSGTVLHPAAKPGRVLRYALAEHSAEVLKQQTDGLYGWLHPDLPEDLVFLREHQEPWLTSVARERRAWLSGSRAGRDALVSAVPELAALLAERPAAPA